MFVKWCVVWPIKKMIEFFMSDKVTKETKKKQSFTLRRLLSFIKHGKKSEKRKLINFT